MTPLHIDIQKLCTLAKLQLSDEQAAAFSADLENVLQMIETMKTIDVTGLEPLHTPLEQAQPLRADIVAKHHSRAELQRDNPYVTDHFYTVPKIL